MEAMAAGTVAQTEPKRLDVDQEARKTAAPVAVSFNYTVRE
jgi:hypothetical protein